MSTDTENANLTDAQQIAEIIHEHTCQWNHTDGCAWYYETWNDANRQYSVRKDYLHRAEHLLTRYTPTQTTEFLGMLYQQIK